MSNTAHDTADGLEDGAGLIGRSVVSDEYFVPRGGFMLKERQDGSDCVLDLAVDRDNNGRCDRAIIIRLLRQLLISWRQKRWLRRRRFRSATALAAVPAAETTTGLESVLPRG